MSYVTPSIFDKYPDYEAVIGIETHVQLKTKSKMFCGCPNRFGGMPNAHICPICAGNPGTLPVLNRKVIDFAIMAGLATNCKISTFTTFARKHYMYPDLPKNFQITQDNKPICHEGFVAIEREDGAEKKVRLIRIHMEEDAGKNIHGEVNESYVDLNRAGTPLLEIVTYPDLSNAHEARDYLTKLRGIVQYLDISDANMEEGSFRADTNISVRKKGSTKLGTKVELKNINSFKFIGQAIDYEIERQIEILENGGTIIQETRLWDTKKQISIPMRTKEEADDYRYFTEPDLPPVMISDEWIERLSKKLPELPDVKLARFKKEYELVSGEAETFIDNRNLAIFFEQVVAICKKPKLASNWILRDLMHYLYENKLELSHTTLSPEKFAEFISVIDQGIINSKVAQDVFIEMMKSGNYPTQIIQEKNLKQIDSKDELEKIVQEVINANPESVAKYKAGNERLFMFFVGQAMKATKGKGNPEIIQELLKKHL